MTDPPSPASVEAVARALVNKLEQIHDDPVYRAVWSANHMRYGPYNGPQYTDELAALKAALAQPATAAGQDGDTYTDDNGTVWVPPTAWAYFAACRALRHYKDQLRRHGIELEPVPSLPPSPPNDAAAPTLPRLIEQLHAGCGGSLGCQLLHQAAAEALASMREALEAYACAGSPEACNQTALKDGSCIREIDGTCGRIARATLQDTPTLTGPNDGASLYAAARAMAEYDWLDEPVTDVWAELHPWEQEYYLDHARIARGGTAVRGDG